MTDTPFEVDDAVVLLLGAPSRNGRVGRIEGITRLEKLFFLLDRETPVGGILDEHPDFEAHKFGPFSAKIYQAVETLEAADLITDSAAISATSEDSWESDELIGDEPSNSYTTRDFALTDLGNRYYEALLAELPPGTENDVTELKDQFVSIPLRQLIRYVYTKYPELTGNSVIKDEVLGG
jgi:hypothetical protein